MYKNSKTYKMDFNPLKIIEQDFKFHATKRIQSSLIFVSFFHEWNSADKNL